MSQLAKDKAFEIYQSFSFIEVANYTSKFEIKEASLITVGYIEQALSELGEYDVEYWNEVKLEIESYNGKH